MSAESLRSRVRPVWPIALVACSFLVTSIWLWSSISHGPNTFSVWLIGQTILHPGTIFNDEIVRCYSPWGDTVGQNPRHSIQESAFEDAPQPYAGSYEDLNLEQTWSTSVGRYGPYIWKPAAELEHRDSWESTVDWAALQNRCLQHNLHPVVRKESVKMLSASRKLKLPSWGDRGNWYSTHVKARRKETTGRTAILLRGWSTFEFYDTNFWHLRSLVTETALAYGGRYTVILLVDVQHSDDILSNATHYDEVMQTIPAEFRNMTVLFDQKGTLKSWYPRVSDHRPEFQMEQGRQVFANTFDEFDHIWQLELDVRFTGHAGKLLSSLERFARNEPRKQARERASFEFHPEVYDDYGQFLTAVNHSLGGGSSFWGPLRIFDIKPIGPQPPVLRPEDDDFQWGHAEEADLILLSGAMNVSLDDSWVYKGYIGGFHQAWPPRLMSAPAMSRVSWNLAMQIHDAQIWDGLYLQSEATPISFAMWHGLKISRPPLPMYGQRSGLFTQEDIDIYSNGGKPNKEHDGMAWGEDPYGKKFSQNSTVKEVDPTWAWNGGYGRQLYDAWIGIDHDKFDESATLPKIRDGDIFLPNLMLHSVKTNPHPS